MQKDICWIKNEIHEVREELARKPSVAANDVGDPSATRDALASFGSTRIQGRQRRRQKRGRSSSEVRPNLVPRCKMSKPVSSTAVIRDCEVDDPTATRDSVASVGSRRIHGRQRRRQKRAVIGGNFVEEENLQRNSQRAPGSFEDDIPHEEENEKRNNIYKLFGMSSCLKIVHDKFSQDVEYRIKESQTGYIANAHFQNKEYSGIGRTKYAAKEACAAAIIRSLMP